MSANHYNKNAEEFYISTINIDMSAIYKPFISYLKPNSTILDAGCGTGRDSKFFLKKGYQVEAFDASTSMVNLAQELTGISIKNMKFQQLEEKEKYDGVWACASLLHIPMNELLDSMQRISNALKENGVWYLSFKYGSGEREASGRQFTDLNEDLLSSFISKIKHLSLVKTWKTEDTRKERNDVWLNAIIKKCT